MIVEESVTINASPMAVWSLITDVEHAAGIVTGIERTEIISSPPGGMVGYRWKETRMLFGEEATVEKVITEAEELRHYRTRAEDGGIVFFTTLRMTTGNGEVILTGIHESIPQGITARLKMLPMIFFKGVWRKAVRKDLEDYKAAAEKR